MRQKNVHKSWGLETASKVRKSAVGAIVFGILIFIASLIFSAGFVEKYLLASYSLDAVTLRVIFRARLASGTVGVLLVGFSFYLYHHPGWILNKLTYIGKESKGLAKRFPSVREHYRVFALGIIALFIFMAILHILTGELNEDEGWYLYASKLVYEGRIPYVDFAYTQPPLLPYVYGLIQRIFGASLLLGRIVTSLFGLSALVLTMAVAKIISGERASLLAGAAIAVNPFSIYFMVITKTYSMAATLIALSLYLLFREGDKRIDHPLAGISLALAVGTRLTVAPVFGLFLVYLAIVNRQYILRTITASGLTLTVLFLPFLLLDPRATYFNIVGYHLARYVPQSLLERIFGKMRGFFELLINFPFLIPFILLGIALYILPKIGHYQLTHEKPSKSYWGVLFIFTSFAATFLAHFVPGAALPEYHVLNLPLAAIFAGWLYDKWRTSLSWEYKKALLTILVIGLLLFSFLGARPMQWLLDPRTRYFNLSGGRLPLAEASKVSQIIRDNTSSEEEIFTTHAYLALEARRDLLDGLEMGIFSFYPDWSTKRARRFHVVNFDIIKEYIRSREGKALVITDRDFTHTGIYDDPSSGTREDLIQLIEDNYKLDFTMDNFGQFGQYEDNIYVYFRRSD